MIFPKLTRKRVKAAAGKPVEIAWPKDGPEPKPSRAYTMQASRKAGDARLVVQSAKRVGDGWRAVVCLEADPVRLLGSVSGYSDTPARALRTSENGRKPSPEPEAVPERYQRLLAEEGVLKTVLQGAMQRQRTKVWEQEERHSRAQRNGRQSTVEFLDRKLAHDRKAAA